MMDEMLEITSAEEFDREVLEAEVPVVVTFYADWCGDCVKLCPHVDQWAKQYAGRMKFVCVEDARRDLEERYMVHMIPDVLVFFGGKLIHRWINVIDPDAYGPTFDRLLGMIGT
ncbi:MAG: thioredoxin family protein [Planctomycetota bacterium]|jgi:thioredoxin 1